MMGYHERERVYLSAIDKFGPERQIWKAVEEMSELTKELCKIQDGSANLEHIAEETADTAIMLEQLCLIFRMGDRVGRHMDQKITRLQNKIEKGAEPDG